MLKQNGGHVGHTNQHGGDIHRAMEMLTFPHLATPPSAPGGGIDPVAQAIFQEQVK